MFKTQYYKSQDPIEHFKVKVTLKKLSGGHHTTVDAQNKGKFNIFAKKSGDPNDATTSPSKAEAETAPAVSGPASTSTSLPADISTQFEPVSLVFSWQQKVFGRKEVHTFGPMKEGKTPLEKTYMADIKRMYGESGEGGHVISSYVDKDNYNDDTNWKEHPSASLHGEPRKLNDLAEAMMNRANGTVNLTQKLHKFLKADGGAFDDGTDAIHIRPDFAHLDAVPKKNMYIVASVEDASSRTAFAFLKQKVWLGSEHTLVHIAMHGDYSFEMRPPFSPKSPETGVALPYRFETTNGAVYEYTVESASDQPSEEFLRQESLFKQDMNQRSLELRRNLVGKDFIARPPKGSTRIHLAGEIKSAHGYERTDLYVYFQLETSEGWSLQSGETSANTHISVAQFNKFKEQYIAHFCHPLSWDFTRSDESNQTPRVFFQIASYDSLDRYTVEGYGVFDLPRHPGRYTYEVRTWRPKLSIRDQMHSFFIGGYKELQDIRYTSQPTDFKAKVMNKYGFATETSGVVTFVLDSVWQTSDVPKEKLIGAGGSSPGYSPLVTPRASMQKAPTGQRLVLSTTQILERARKRLLQNRATVN
eukprot:GFYU01009557.1.p1 GENE.GFYU01009557.1~~GFYU01009557.1.p1  ORF type:complete len:587 (+),score=144.10 GFYU01009557.1:263-2023(+)